jgi:hypothetical protein
MSDPVISVVVVSDYAGGTPGSLDDFRHCLRALAAQDFDEPVEVLLSEWEGCRNHISTDLETLVPSLRIVYSDARSAFDLKNEGARRARAGTGLPARDIDVLRSVERGQQVPA